MLHRDSASTRVPSSPGPDPRLIDIATLVAVTSLCAFLFSFPLRSHAGLLQFAQDDFFYYLKPAQNLAAGHGSSFDGSTPTNGFHPLYFLLLTCASFFVHTLPAVFRLLWVLDLISALAIFLLGRNIFRKVAPNPFLVNALALTLTLTCIPLLCNQMEVTLAIPLGLAFLAVGFVHPSSYTPPRCAALGLLGALTMLARLDASILVFIFLLSVLLSREFRAALTFRNALAFALAFLPLPLLYIGLNHHFFHVLMPISGVAKELRHRHRPSSYLIGSFSGRSQLFVNTSVATGVLAIAVRRFLRPEEKLFLFAGLSSPFLFYGLEMFISDWPLWNWYFYSLRFAFAATLLVAGIFWSRPVLSAAYPLLRRLLANPWLPRLFYAVSLLALVVTHYKVDHWMVEIQHAAFTLDQFEADHPGKYAMGDRAGMFAYTVKSPVLQAEGLVMDKPYVEHIRAQDDLRSVLSSYGVNYYVAFVFTGNLNQQFQGPCFHAREPSIAGPDSFRMRSTLCQPPLFAFPGFDGKYFVFQINPT